MRLRWRIVGVLLAVSLLPILLLGIGAWVVFGRLLVDETLALERSAVESHAATIDLYLGERTRGLELLARSYGLEELTQEGKLAEVFDALSESYPGAFVDLGVIGQDGSHLAYVGPYDLRDRNYAGAKWFRSVMAEGEFVSDVFLGFRQVPHCVVAVRRKQGNRIWILRATVSGESFYSLVRVGERGKSGDVFVINTRGEYQTPPRLGAVLDASPIAAPTPHSGVRAHRVVSAGRRMLEITTWLNQNRWLLVAQRDEDEIRAPVYGAIWRGALVVFAAVLLVGGTTVLATWHLTNRIDRADRERARLTKDLMRSAKLASLGELAAGFAHEINNPLAIISAEQTNLRDRIEDLGLGQEDSEALFQGVDRCKRQVQRCGGITAKMLQFGRKPVGPARMGAIDTCMHEVVELMRRQAAVRNVKLALDATPGLPRVPIDATELEQVVVNLIGNALGAIEGSGTIAVTARHEGGAVVLTVRDDGSGMPPEVLDRAFEPFFTTKPVGKGTGLGLSVCYGIVTGWGGKMHIASKVGQGTEVTVEIPAPPAGRAEGRPMFRQEGVDQHGVSHEETRTRDEASAS